MLAAADVLAMGAMEALEERGVKVPEEFAVVGFNDNPVSSVLKPALTTVDLRIYELGATAATMLIRILDGDVLEEKHVVIPARLVIHQSCGYGGGGEGP